MDGITIGQSLKRHRRERGMTQEQLAERSGVSVDLIAKLEQGRRSTARISSLMKLARALDIELGALTDKRERIGADRPEGSSVLAVRDALLSPSLLPGMSGLDADDDGRATPLPDLERAVTQGWDKYWSGDFGGLAATMPGLIGEARLTQQVLGAPAANALAQTYELAACLMVQLGREDLAAIAAERGIIAATRGDDELQWATVNGTYAWVLLHQGRLEESEGLAIKIAQRIEPSFSSPEAHLAAWGNLLMSALAPAVAAGRDPGDYLSLAAAGAERLGRRVDVYQTAFGPATVAMQSVHAYAVLQEPGKALKAAGRMRQGDLLGISRSRHLLDVAQAHVYARQPRAAVAKLTEAQQRSPVWFRHQGIARSLVAEVREAETRMSPEVRSLARSVGLD